MKLFPLQAAKPALRAGKGHSMEDVQRAALIKEFVGRAETQEEGIPRFFRERSNSKPTNS
ncbi:MAG TPA: hypothetical protein VIK52_01975 [Opitutaceae bacterium]